MLTRSLVAMGLLFISSLQVASSQAFGIQMGQPISSLPDAVSDDGPDKVMKTYVVTRPPSPHTEFQGYLVFAAAALGVCKVVGIGNTHSNDAFGTSIRNTYNDLRNTLVSKYGTGKEFDFLVPSSIWDEPDDFAMGIRMKDRNLQYFWTQDEGSNLPDRIAAISLSVQASGNRDTYVNLGYEFSNFEACINAQDQSNNLGL